MGGNTLEFFVKMRDMMSSGLVKMAKTAKSTFDNVQKSVSQVTGKNRILSQSFDEIGRKISQTEAVIRNSTIPSQIQAARRELERLQNIQTKHPGNTDKGSTSGSGGGFIRSLVGPALIGTAIAAATSVFSAGAKREQDIVGLRTFLGKGAEGAYKNIQKDAAATPFDTDSLLKTNRALISAGVSAEAARKDTMNLANAIAATGGGNDELQRMAANMQQIKNTGKATAADIKQFGFAGINIYQALANATGKSIAQVREMDVSYDLLAFSLDKAARKGGVFAGALEAQSKTVFGRWSTLLDNFKIGAADVGASLQPLMHGLLDIGMVISNHVVPAVVDLVKWITENWDWIGLLVSAITAAVIGYWSVIGATKAWAFAQTLLNVAMNLNPLGLIVAGIAALVAVIIYAWNTFEGFRMVVYGLWDAFKQVFTNIGDLFKKTFQPIFDAIRLFKEGKFVEAGLLVAKAPGLMAVNAAKFTLNGGLTKGVADAYKSGSEKGRDAKATLSTAAVDGSNARGNNGSGSTPLDTTAEKVTSGGPRVININGVKFADSIQITVQEMKEGADELEQRFQEMFLRVLNSGASLQ